MIYSSRSPLYTYTNSDGGFDGFSLQGRAREDDARIQHDTQQIAAAHISDTINANYNTHVIL